MSWADHHARSETFASEAAIASRAGERARAESLYKEAAVEEAAALDAVPAEKHRTRGVTAVSAVALWYKGRDYPAAERLAYRCLADGQLSSFATTQLRDLLHMIWTASAAESSGIRFVPGDVLVSVKGGQVIYGGGPLDLIVQKVEGIQAVLFRTVEMLLARPFRRRGGPPIDIQSMFRPWLFQAPAGSYQFAVRMQEPEQRELWETDRPKLEQVTATFFKVLRATAADAESELANVVPDPQYRGAFLNLSRNLAPTGRAFERLEIRDAAAPAEPVVSLASDTRQQINVALRGLKPPSTLSGVDEPLEIHGTLRAVHLDQDWLEVAVTAGAIPEHVRIDEAGDVLDDVIGPMVNRKVVVSAVRRGMRNLYRDIELEE